MHVYVDSGRCIGPNDVIFFPAKIELRPDLVVEISTGNTPESSTELRPKSAILGRNVQISTLKSVAGRNFYGSQIFEN